MVALNAIFGASATGSMSVNIPVPANVAAGKRVVGVGIGPGITTPPGFTDIFTAVADAPNMRVFQKIATGADSGTYNAGGGVLATNDGMAWKLNGENSGPPWVGTLIGGVRRTASSTTPTFSIPDPGQGVMLIWITAIEGNAVTCGIPSLFTRRTPNSAQRLHVFTRVTTSGNLSGLVAALGAQSTSRTLIIPTRPSGLREADDGVLELWEAGAAADGSQDRRVSLWEAGAATDGSQDGCIS